MDPIGAGAALHRPTPPEVGVRMNVTAHQENEKNEEMKTGKRKVGEGRRQATDFKKAVRCPSAVVQRAARQKN